MYIIIVMHTYGRRTNNGKGYTCPSRKRALSETAHMLTIIIIMYTKKPSTANYNSLAGWVYVDDHVGIVVC